MWDIRAASHQDGAAGLLLDALIPDDDPAWLAAMNAPLDDAPDTDQERADIAEARGTGRFVSGADVRRTIAAQSLR
jgi:hypothetical protein